MTSVVANLAEGPPIQNNLGSGKLKFTSGSTADQIFTLQQIFQKSW